MRWEGKAKVIVRVEHKERCAGEVVWLLPVKCGCIETAGVTTAQSKGRVYNDTLNSVYSMLSN